MIETEAIKSFIFALAFPVGRSIAGWAEHALKDNKITNFEWKQLGQTVIRVGIMSAAIYFGADGLGIDINTLASGASAFIIDKIISSVKQK